MFFVLSKEQFVGVFSRSIKRVFKVLGETMGI